MPKNTAIQFLLAAFQLMFVPASAQMDPVGDFNKHIASNWKGEYIRIAQYRVKGSPYFLGESFPGIITFQNGKSVADIKVLYNLHDQKAGAEVQGGMLEGDTIAAFSILLPEKFGSREMVFRHSRHFDAAGLNIFFQVLEEGNRVSLLKAYRSRLSPDPANQMARDLKVFEQYFEYYLYQQNSRQLHRLKLREKDLARLLDNSSGIQEYFTNHKPDITREDILIQLIKHYNDLP